MKLQWLYIIAEGIVATMLMTIFVNLAGKGVNVIRTLGTMLLGLTTPGKHLDRSRVTFIVGTLAHYLIGVLFAIAYNVLRLKYTGMPGFWYSVVFGIGAGILAVISWKLFVLVHPNPPLIPQRFYLLIFIGHIIFGVGVFLVIQLFPSISS